MMVLQGSHTNLATPLHSHWISVWSGSSVGLAGVGSARLLLLLRIRAVCHAVKLGALHGHGVHRCHLLGEFQWFNNLKKKGHKETWLKDGCGYLRRASVIRTVYSCTFLRFMVYRFV